MNALQLVTAPRPFFDQQVLALERAGVRCRTLTVHQTSDNGDRSPVNYLRFYPRALKRITDGFDIVHANHGLTAPFALAQPSRPVVLTFWGSELLGDQSTPHRLVRRLSGLTARHADRVILPSRSMTPHLDVDHTLVPFGVDTDRFRPIPRSAARGNLGWDPDEQYVLFPSKPSRPEKRFRLAEAVVERTGATLRTMSAVPHSDVPYYLNASDAVIITSRHESGPMVVKEAAACNVPVVSTDVGFVSEVLAGVSNTAVCDGTDELVAALRRILDSGCRSDGRSAITGLDLDEMGRQLRRVYEGALEDRRAARD